MAQLGVLRRRASSNGDKVGERFSRRPKDTPFLQQRMNASQQILTPQCMILSFLILGIVFIPVGATMVWLSSTVTEETIRYDDICPEGSQCDLSIILPSMDPPVYMYYRLSGFYQNHRRYVASCDATQLNGKLVTDYSDLSQCDFYNTEAIDAHDVNKFNLPCGLMARSLFNDTFELLQAQDGSNASVQVPLRKRDIAWTVDRTKLFQNPPADAPSVRIVPDFQDEDFVVWMRPAPLPDFKKLHRIIDSSVGGNYSLRVNNVFPTASLKYVKKYVVFSTLTAAGGKNSFLGWVYVAAGIALIIQAIAFFLQHRLCPRRMGDLKYLNWDMH